MIAPDRTEHVDVAIVGAGFAGLAAAQYLTARGTGTLVLEAADRAGGRAFTDYAVGEGFPAELGAQMIHGRHAAARAWAERYGLATRPLPILRRHALALEHRVARFPWYFRPFHPFGGTRAAWTGAVAEPRRLDAYTGPERSLSEHLDEVGAKPLVRTLVDLRYAHVMATDPDRIGILGPAREYREASDPFEYRNAQLVAGYSELARRAARGLGERVRLGWPVRAVERSPRGVRLTTGPREAGGDRWVACRAAIITVSLGVLKSRSIDFVPPLPPRTLRAIDEIGFGHAYALQLRLSPGRIRDRIGDVSVLWGPTSSSFHRPRVGLSGAPELLTAFTVGHVAQERAYQGMGAILRGNASDWAATVPAGFDLGPIEAVAVHPWSTDPWVRGAYSFLPPGALPEHRRELARPIDDQLFLAGEAACTTGQSSTVTGAITSGERAAEAALRAIRPNGGTRSGAMGAA